MYANLCKLLNAAFLEAFIAMLAYAMGDVKMDAKSVHQWTKLYRVFEQSIISNVVRL
jgi:hypothetical protein